ncbi:MAG TPA: hypothetical protein VF868_11005 [Bacteroidia bacterium]|jgi:F0F1-type ATP synthase membrane subunit c/vacuolar-type H+-ATPase subunit K
MNSEKINFRVARDFGETFNVSIKFLRQNFRLLIQSLIFMAGPFILLTAICGAYYQANAIETFSIGQARHPLANFGLNYFLFILAGIVSNLAIIGTVYSFMIEYMDKGYGNFNLNDVGRRLRNNIGNILSVFFSLTLLILLFLGAIIGVFIAIGSAAPWLAVLLGVCAVIALLIFFPPLMWQLSVVYMVKMSEDENVFDSFGRTKSVMRGNFWWTWVIVICATMAIGVISFVFSIPQVAYQMISMISRARGNTSDVSIIFLIVATMCTFCTSLIYSLLYIINAFHYFSLAEKQDGTGLMDRINEIGQTPAQNVEKQY